MMTPFSMEDESLVIAVSQSSVGTFQNEGPRAPSVFIEMSVLSGLLLPHIKYVKFTALSHLKMVRKNYIDVLKRKYTVYSSTIVH